MPYSTVQYSSLSLSSLQDSEAPKGVLDLPQLIASQGGERGIHEQKLHGLQQFCLIPDSTGYRHEVARLHILFQIGHFSAFLA